MQFTLLLINSFIHSPAVNTLSYLQCDSGSRVFPGNTGCEVERHPGEPEGSPRGHKENMWKSTHLKSWIYELITIKNVRLDYAVY